MRGLKIFVEAAAVALAMTCAAGGALAQTAPGASGGQPVPLLAGLRPPHETKHAVHGKPEHRSNTKAAAEYTRRSGAKKTARREHERRAHHVAERRTTLPSRFAAPPAPPQTALSFAPTETPSPAPATALDDAAPVATPAITPPADDDSGTIAINGQSVQVQQPDQINSLDRAAPPAASSTQPLTTQAHAATGAPQSVLAAPAQAEKSDDAASVASDSWIAQVLAALGGAIAAGAVAWILIGSGPVRTYG